MSTPLVSPAQVSYLTSGDRLARLGTADAGGRPHVTPVGMWRYLPDTGVVEITGHDFSSTRKFRNVAANPQAALVVDDVAPGEGWHPRGVMLEGPAEARAEEGGEGLIRIRPDRVVSWGI